MEEMADIVVSPIIKVILDQLASPLLRDFGSEWEVEKELNKLLETLEKTHALLGFAEPNQRHNALLKLCLRDLRDEAYEIDDTLDEFIYEAHRQRLDDERNNNRWTRQVTNFLSFSLNTDQLLRRHEIAPLLAQITNKLVTIEKELNHFYNEGAIERRQLDMLCKLQSFSSRSTRQKTGSSVDDSYVFGRREDVNDIINMLLSESYNEREVSIVAIVGLGGIGKTTLAQLVYNDPNVEQHFDVRSWVWVSQDFDVVRLTKAILESATRENIDLRNLQPLQSKLEDTLRGSRFLLVLDDVWNENPNTWNALRVLFRVAAKGSTVIVTTRSKRVASIMGAIKTLCLEVLSDEDCWLLFKKRAFTYNNSVAHPNLEPIGKNIVGKCKGLPLAVNTLGGLLNGKVNEEEWQFIADSEIWDLEESDILPALNLSYQHLPPYLKLCFAYCSIFPKDYIFKKKILVQLWMAEGFVPSKKVERMEDIGGQYFDDLYHKSFFQKVGWESTHTFVMHDLMHDLAQLVSSEMCFRMEIDKSCVISKKARHMSIDNLNLVNMEFYKCRRLSTFLNLGQMTSTYFAVLHDLFDSLRCIRVLDLHLEDNFKTALNSIGNLKHLRYLNLRSSQIEVLPEQTCNLYNLQTLNLDDCRSLCEIPKSMGNLINLQNLFLNRDFWHKYKPQLQGIGRLTCLKTLPYFYVGKEDGFKIKELKELRHLEGQLSISKLENVVNVMEAKEANLKNKHKLDGLELCWSSESSHLRDGEDIEGVLEGLQPHTGLKHLGIHCYDGLTFPSWMMNLSCYNKLVSMTLDSCSYCKMSPPLGQLCFLKSLTILKMEGLEYWSGAGEGELPCLQNLTILDCPKLKTLPPLLPAVKKLVISSCGVLTMLPRLPSISTLILNNCDGRILNWVHQCTSIESLFIYDIQDATSLPPAMLQPLRALQRLRIYSLNKLVSLSEDVGLQDLASLQDLEIRSCPMLTSLPKRLHKLSSLEKFTIEECGIIALFHEEASLPPVLSCLDIDSCHHLETLSNKLRNLSSLQKLYIWGCSNLRSLPEEGLPTSLCSLSIENCPKLMSRCREGGEDWPGIAHIPEVRVSGSSVVNFEVNTLLSMLAKSVGNQGNISISLT